MTTPVLLDSGCIVALLDRNEARHRECVDAVSMIGAPLVTCEAVLAEACYLVRGLPRAAAAILENVEAGTFLVPFNLSSSAQAVRALMHKYSDLPMDLADGCLVHLAGLLATGRILTLDSDFTIYRWGRNRPFEIIPSQGGHARRRPPARVRSR